MPQAQKRKLDKRTRNWEWPQLAPLRRHLPLVGHPANQPTLPKLDSPLIGTSGQVSIPWYKFFFLLLQRVLNGTPIGSLSFYAGAAAPAGWLLCQGQNVSRTTYELLFGVLGATYGAGDGVSTFGLPDCRGRSLFGLDAGAGRLTLSSAGGLNGAALGNAGGEQAHVSTLAETATHDHTGSTLTGTTNNMMTNTSGVNNRQVGGAATLDITDSVGLFIAFAGSNAAHNTVPPGIVFNVMIYTGIQ